MYIIISIVLKCSYVLYGWRMLCFVEWLKIDVVSRCSYQYLRIKSIIASFQKFLSSWNTFSTSDCRFVENIPTFYLNTEAIFLLKQVITKVSPSSPFCSPNEKNTEFSIVTSLEKKSLIYDNILVILIQHVLLVLFDELWVWCIMPHIPTNILQIMVLRYNSFSYSFTTHLYFELVFFRLSINIFKRM